MIQAKSVCFSTLARNYLVQRESIAHESVDCAAH